MAITQCVTEENVLIVYHDEITQHIQKQLHERDRIKNSNKSTVN